ncbi:MAG TPA: IPT/TIG domain-containing protein, partial [Acidimicrobiales bacterium]|nr:IPT/TIG domain-containing protein [Acidimicrobiales bacterium]
AALNAGGYAQVDSISCSSADNCSAGGYYYDASRHDEAFLVNEASGHWGKAEEVPGTAALNAGGQATVDSVSCTSAGNCSAGGAYYDALGHQQALVVSYFPRPAVTKLLPHEGPASGGTTVTITGKNLFGSTAVHFGTGVARIDQVVSATEIKVTSPKGSGTVAVTVTTPGGTSTKTEADRYTY